MSFDPNTGLPTPPAKQGMSGCMKAVLIIGVLGLILGGGCCGALWLFGPKMFQEVFQVNEDPQHAAAEGAKLVEADFLNDFPAKTSVVFNMPFVGTHIMTMVMYGGDDTGMVMIGQMNPQIAQGQNKQQMDAQFRDAMNKQSNKGNVQTLSSTTRQLTVRGQSTPFSFSKVKPNEGPQKGVETWMVTGLFDGKSGPTFIMLMVPTADYGEDDLVEMIESIK